MTKTRDELLTRYAAGRGDFIRANVTGEDLAGANLVGANLAGANLDSADLAGATLPRGFKQ